MICLTFDTDWMTDHALARFIQEFPIPGKATFFLHDNFPSLATSSHELCPHPLISDLGNWHSSLTKLAGALRSAPRGVRPHSCVFSHMVGLELRAMGFQYISQASNLYQQGLAPFRHPWGIWELPIYYMDNMDLCMAKNWPGLNHEPFNPDIVRVATEQEGLFVFDFHPIHIALNTLTHDDYETVKTRIVNDGMSPFEMAFLGRGVRTFFEELCLAMRERGQVSFTCSAALDELARGHSTERFAGREGLTSMQAGE
jgi:hypothetical protein